MAKTNKPLVVVLVGYIDGPGLIKAGTVREAGLEMYEMLKAAGFHRDATDAEKTAFYAPVKPAK